MRKTAKPLPQAASRPQGNSNAPRGTSSNGATCLTYTLSLPDLIIVAVDASDGVTAPTIWIDKHITAAWPDVATALTALMAHVQQTRHPAAATLEHPTTAIDSAHATCLPIMDATGTPTQLLLAVTIAHAPATPDLTVAEPGKLMQIIDDLPVGILWTDMHGRVKYTNRKQRSILNYAIGATVIPLNADLPHPHWLRPDTHEPYRRNELPIPQTIATGISAEAVVMNDDVADDMHVILIKTQPVFDNAGQMSDIIAVQIDLTAQYHAEQVAMRRAAEQDTVIDGMVDGIIMYDRHGAPARYNQAVLQILGWTQTGIDPLQISEGERVAFYNAHMITDRTMENRSWPSMQALAGNHPEPVEIVFRHPDGTRVITYVHAVPLRDPVTNEITGAATIVRDITKLRQLDYMKDEFMSVASHELRTPLTSLLLTSRLMQRWMNRPDRAEDLRRLADDMAGQVKHMDRLINNMLDLTRINAQHFAMVTQPTDITQMVRSVSAEQRAASGHAITYAGVHAPVPVAVDCERMRQVLTNVLSNAVKYDSSPLPIAVTLSLVTDQVNRGGAHVVIAVHDHGYGITAERLPHLFEQSYHNPDDAATGQNLDGMGLSLYICQAIVERHGGKIWAKSVVGAGSIFYIELPIDLPASPPRDYYDEPPMYIQQEMLQ